MVRILLGLGGVGLVIAVLSFRLGRGGDTAIDRSLRDVANAVEREFPDEANSKGATAADRREFFAAPNGTAGGDGSQAQPWNLHLALARSERLKPGDVLWLRGGRYQGAFVSQLYGRKTAPIIVRQYPGERAILDGCAEPPEKRSTLTIQGEYTWFWDFEVTNCSPLRKTSSPGSSPPELDRGMGVEVFGTDIKLIHLVVHDTAQGIAAWIPARRAELYGNLVYYNGWDGPDRGHGHGIYVQNEEGLKKITQNVIFDQFGTGIHAYAENGTVSHIQLRGNIVFNNGSLSTHTGLLRNLTMGGLKPPTKNLWIANRTYFPFSVSGGNDLGYTAGCADVQIQDNYFAGREALQVDKCSGLLVNGNAFVGASPRMWRVEFPQNEYIARPNGVVSDVQPSKWEEGRATVVVYNWDHKPRVTVDVSHLGWKKGQRYLLRNVQDYFGDSVRGEYEDAPLALPMQGWSQARPAGAAPPPSTFPEFGVFLLETDNEPLKTARARN